MIETRNKLTIENNNSTMSDLVFLLLVFFMMTSNSSFPRVAARPWPSRTSQSTSTRTTTSR